MGTPWVEERRGGGKGGRMEAYQRISSSVQEKKGEPDYSIKKKRGRRVCEEYLREEKNDT